MALRNLVYRDQLFPRRTCARGFAALLAKLEPASPHHGCRLATPVREECPRAHWRRSSSVTQKTLVVH